METLFIVTGLAQWAGSRTGAGVGSGGYRVRFRAGPRVICYRMFEGFLNILGYVWDTFSDICRTFSEMFGTCFRTFSEMFGTCFRTFSDMFGTCVRTFFGHFRTCLGHVSGYVIGHFWTCLGHICGHFPICFTFCFRKSRPPVGQGRELHVGYEYTMHPSCISPQHSHASKTCCIALCVLMDLRLTTLSRL